MDRDKSVTRRKWLPRKKMLAFIALAVIAAIGITAFPLQIHQDSPDDAAFHMISTGVGSYYITIGNLVNAQDADYTCDGVDDHVQFQQALDALPDIGGQLFALAGQYNWGNNETVTRAIDSVSIIGIGASVAFSGDDSTPIFTAGGDRWLFSNFQTDAGGLEMGSTSNWMWLNIFIDGTLYSLEAPDDPVGGMEIHDNEYHDPDFATEAAMSALNSTVTTLQSDVTTLQSDVTTLQSDVTTLEGTVAGHTSDISTLQSDVTTLETDVTTLQSDVTTLQSDVTTLQSTVSGHTSDISTLQSDVITLQSDVTTLQSDVTTLQSTVSGHTSDISTLQSDVTTLQSDVTTLQSDVTTLETDVSDLQTRMTAAESDIDDLELVSHTQGTDTTMGTLTADIDYAGYMAVTMSCDQGTTMPGSPSQGQWYLHKPTGRTILYQYDGSAWASLQSFGTMTLYVDATDGTDDLDHGTGVDSNAFDTIQYAFDCIPPNYGGAVEIHINGEAYTETLTLGGKQPTGDYAITLVGSLTEDESETTVNSAGQNNGNVGYVTVSPDPSWTNDEFQHELLRFEDDTTTTALQGDEHIIDTNDSDTIDIACTFDAVPVNGDTFTVLDFATSITGDITVTGGQTHIKLDFLKIIGRVMIYAGSEVEIDRCYITDTGNTIKCEEQSIVDIDNCFLHNTGVAGSTVWFANNGAGDINNSKILGSSDSENFHYGLLVEASSSCYLNQSILEYHHSNIVIKTGSVVRHWGGSANDSKIRSYTYGVNCEGAAGMSGSSHLDYDGSGTNTLTATYGYLL